MNKKRIFLLEFHQESNTFNPITAKLEDFYIGSVPEGAEGYERMKAQTGMVRGMIDVLEAAPAVCGLIRKIGIPEGGALQLSPDEAMGAGEYRFTPIESKH